MIVILTNAAGHKIRVSDDDTEFWTSRGFRRPAPDPEPAKRPAAKKSPPAKSK